MTVLSLAIARARAGKFRPMALDERISELSFKLDESRRELEHARRHIDLLTEENKRLKRMLGVERGPSIASIKELVAREYRLGPSDLIARRRSLSIVWPRHVAMYLAKTRTPCSYHEIGRRFGDRDPTTVLHAVRVVSEKRASDPKLDLKLRQFEEQIMAEVAS